jgi:hypothetical protein
MLIIIIEFIFKNYLSQNIFNNYLLHQFTWIAFNE